MIDFPNKSQISITLVIISVLPSTVFHPTMSQKVYFETNQGQIPSGSRPNYSGSVTVNGGKVSVSSIISDGPIPAKWPATSAQLNPALDGVTVTLFLPDGSTKKLSGGSTSLDKIDLNQTQIQATK